MDRTRIAIIGAAALGVAGIGALVGVSLDQDEAAPDKAAAGGEYEVCLKTAIGFFEEAGARCYDRAALGALRDRSVLDPGGRAIAVTMTPPADAARPPAQYSTCREYDVARSQDWYAMTTRDMRREAYFTRACGALDLLARAGPARTSHFAGGSPTSEEIAALGGDRLLRMGPAPASGTPQIEKAGAAEWRISYGDQRVILQEIANADFDGDGIEEILVFIAARPEGGTATISAVALLEKDSAGGPATLTPAPATRPREGPSGAP